MRIETAGILAAVAGAGVLGSDCAKPHCASDTCAGCCTTEGQCLLGDDHAACGKNGVACADCAKDGRICGLGLCRGTPPPPSDGGGPGPDASVQPIPARNCSGDLQCNTNERCHPVGRVCVPSCITAVDCPAGQTDCNPVFYTEGGQLKQTSWRACKCMTDAQCLAVADAGPWLDAGSPDGSIDGGAADGGVDAGPTRPPAVCNSVDDQCQPGCSENGHCAAFNPPRQCRVDRCAP